MARIKTMKPKKMFLTLYFCSISDIMRDMTKQSTIIDSQAEAEKDKALVIRLKYMLPILDEKLTRRFLAVEAKFYGYGGITKVSQLSGVSVSIIRKGIKELNEPQDIAGGVRKKARKRKKEGDNEGNKKAGNKKKN